MELPPLSKETYIQAMREKVEQVLGSVADAVNAAPMGKVITGSEEKVRDLMADLRRVAFEKAVQMRVDEGEESFSPSTGCSRRPSPAEQGVCVAEHAHGERPDRAPSASLAPP